MNLSLVEYRAQRIGQNSKISAIAMNNTLRVLQEYQFNCSSANITSLILGIDVRTDNDCQVFPKVQVFEPDGYGGYNRVASTERTIYYSTSNVSTNGVFEYPLNPPIRVFRGDLLSISALSENESVVRMYYISNETVSFISSQDFAPQASYFQDISVVTDQLILIYPITGKTHTHCIIELFYYHQMDTVLIAPIQSMLHLLESMPCNCMNQNF